MGQVVELVNVFILAQIVIKAENVAVKGDNKYSWQRTPSTPIRFKRDCTSSVLVGKCSVSPTRCPAL